MQPRHTFLWLGCACCVGLLVEPALAVPAFSGAEGFGAITGGGRGGDVVHVTNLNDSGPGSFRAAVTASGPRTVVFDVSGIIQLQSEVSITNPFLTIAGQTAPGDGVIVAGETVSMDTHDVIVRYMRFRRGITTREDDSFGPDRTPGNMIIDHVSASWGYDENMSVYRNKNTAGNVIPTHNVTIQWSISSEALNEPSADHPFGHAFGSTLGGKGVNFHHNLWASNTGRNPSLSFSHFIDFRNNVIFNWQHRSMDGAGPEAHVNVINNYYQPGPATGKANSANEEPIPHLKVLIVEPEIRQGVYPGGVGWWYVDGNIVEGYPEVTADNWEGESEVAPGVFARGVQFEQPFPVDWARVTVPHSDLSNPGPYPFAPDPRDPYDAVIPPLPTIATQSAEEARQWVLDHAGATLPLRDAVDVRVAASVIDGNPTWGPDGDGIVHVVSDVGGYPVIPFEARDANWDADQDGMRDEWETNHGLDPGDPADRSGDFDADGYTNLEDYLNEVGAFQAVQPIVWDNTLGNNRYAQIENWDIAFQPSRFDTAVIRSGTAEVDAMGQHAGTLSIAPESGDVAAINVAAGRLEAHDAIVIGGAATSQGTLNLYGGELTTPLLSKGLASAFNFTGGTLHADVVNFDVTNEGGTLAPGRSIGTTLVTGDLTLDDGVLEIEIGGKQLGQYDRVEVDGAVTLGGTLRVELIELNSGPYVPQQGDSFAFLAAFGGGGGMFDALELPDLPPGLAWAIGPGDVTYYLTIISAPTLPGDFNNDGTVDVADYIVWRKTDGAPGHYNTWRTNFGATQSGSGSSAKAPSEVSVPEPKGWLVFAILFAILRAKRPNDWLP